MRRLAPALLLASLAALTPLGAPTRAQDGKKKPLEDPASKRELPPVVIPPVREGVTYLRAFAFGDMGTAGRGQRAIAASMAGRAREGGLDLLLTTGDNFYPNGVKSVDDPMWRTHFWDIYSDPALAVPIYPSLGNHDHRGNVQAQIDQGKLEPRWRLPSRYHVWQWPAEGAPVAQFFVIDSDMFPEDKEQLAWLDRALGAATAPWRIVYGHHPIYSRSVRGDNAELVACLEPLLVKHEVDLYLAGHDHVLELRKPKDGVRHLVSGGGAGGDHPYPVEWTDDYEYASTGGGFCALRLAADELVIEFVRQDGRTQFASTFGPRRAAKKERYGPF